MYLNFFACSFFLHRNSQRNVDTDDALALHAFEKLVDIIGRFFFLYYPLMKCRCMSKLRVEREMMYIQCVMVFLTLR